MKLLDRLRRFGDRLSSIVSMPVAALAMLGLPLWSMIEARRTPGTALDYLQPAIDASAPFLRILLPLALLWCVVGGALLIVSRWRDFALPPAQNVMMADPSYRKVMPFGIAFMPFILIYMAYGGSVILFAETLWLYASCSPLDTIKGVGAGFACSLQADFHSHLLMAFDQFGRGVFGDFIELLHPADPIWPVEKDSFLIVLTGFYRMFAQTAVIVLPASFFAGLRTLSEIARLNKAERSALRTALANRGANAKS